KTMALSTMKARIQTSFCPRISISRLLLKRLRITCTKKLGLPSLESFSAVTADDGSAALPWLLNTLLVKLIQARAISRHNASFHHSVFCQLSLFQSIFCIL